MAMTETVLQAVGLVPLLMGFAEHLGEDRLKGLEATVKSRLTPRGLILLPREVFKQSSLALTWNEALMTATVLLFVGLIFQQPHFSTVKSSFIDLIVYAGSPLRWASETLGVVGEIVVIPLSVLLALLLGFLLPMLVLLVLVTMLILLLLYPLLGLLAVTSWFKKQLGLSGSIIKIASFSLALVLYMVSLVSKIIGANGV